MELYVVRHGETEENITKIMQGEMETKLDEVGINQAVAIKKEIDKLQIDLIFSSPQERAYNTAKIIFPNQNIFLDNRLKSRNHGEFQGVSRKEMKLDEYWNFRTNKQYIKAESVHDLFTRVNSFLREIKTKYPDKTVLLVTHSGICRVLHYYFNGIPDDGNLLEYESHNCSLEKYIL